jgi:hypothetical protein
MRTICSLAGFLILFSGTIDAQQPCKVLVEALQGEYSGGCKKGLANGQGKASGTDTYEGHFKNGYPHGKGTYTWANGSVFTGYWNMGKRVGEGSYRFIENGKEVTLKGIWKNDQYMGEKPAPPKIVKRYNINQVSFHKAGEGNQVVLLFRQGGMANSSVMDLMIGASNGLEFRSGSQIGYQQVTFPFEAKITYKTWNPLRTVLLDCTLEFIITEPGRWEVRIEN